MQIYWMLVASVMLSTFCRHGFTDKKEVIRGIDLRSAIVHLFIS